MLIDCETGAPLDLLEGRDAEPLADWQQQTNSDQRQVQWHFTTDDARVNYATCTQP